MAAVPTITVDRHVDEPAYEQIARQIRALVTSGVLPAGAVLPSVRALAADLGVNLNTVARAYRVLSDQCFVRIRDRSGVVVAAPAPWPAPGSSASLQAELDGLLARMRQAGVSPDDVRRMVGQGLNRVPHPGRESER
jgi:DNA-binding transcriptional regulator YhcF (GntR family)